MNIFEIDIFGITIAPSFYGLMYVLAFLYGLYYLHKKTQYSSEQIDSLFLYVFLGTLLGGRIGYILFYNFSSYLSDPLSVIKIWEGGMSFHGGFLGVVIALIIFSRKYKTPFWSLADSIAIIIPVGLFFGRIGNYVNKELLGFPYLGPFAVEKDGGSYFPSPLLEAFLEGLFIYVLFYFVLKKPSFSGQFAALFIFLYGIFRTGVELFVRTPDPQIGYYFGFFTQGSILSIPMIIVGGYLYFYLKKTHNAK